MRPGLGWWLLTVALYKFGDSLGSRMTGPLLTDSGYSLADIGVITGSAGATAGVLGAFVGGATLLRLGHRQALLGFGVLQALGLAGYLLVVGGLPTSMRSRQSSISSSSPTGSQRSRCSRS